MAISATTHAERETTAPVLLCGPDGRLNPDAVTWSRHPLHTCNLPPALARKKKWNYWAVTSEDLLFSATIADVDRLQLAGAYLFHRATKRHIDTAMVRPNSKRSAASQAPSTGWSSRRVSASIRVTRDALWQVEVERAAVAERDVADFHDRSRVAFLGDAAEITGEILL